MNHELPDVQAGFRKGTQRLVWAAKQPLGSAALGPKYWSFSSNISPSNEYSGLISFRMDWLNLLAVQGTLKSLLQLTVQKHQCFGAQLSL